jgi:phage gp37-like protein
MNYIAVTALGAALALAEGCGDSHSSARVEAAGVSTAVSNAPTVSVAKAAVVDLSRGIVVTAEFVSFQEIDVMAKIAGYIKTISVDLGDRVQVPGRYGAIGLNVNIPVLNGGLFRARRTEAELRAQSASQSIRDLENRVVRDVRVAWLGAQTAFERMSLTAQVLDQARLAVDLAQRRYDLGISSIIELTQAQLNLTSAEIDSATAKYDYQSQRSTLAFATGALR